MAAVSLSSLSAIEPVVALGVVARMAGAVAAGGLPVFPRLDLKVRAAATLALAVVAMPAAVSAGDELAPLPLVVGEGVVGFGLGLAAAVVFAAASWAGSILGSVSGLAWADDFTPDAAGGAGEGGVARLASWLAVAGFLAAGGHLAIVAGLIDSVHRLPVGSLAAGGDALASLVSSLLTAALALAISLAAPAVVAILAFHVAAAICLRAVRFTPGAGLLQAAASAVLVAAVFVGAGVWTSGFAAAVRQPLERCFLDLRP
jgi:flagellar biosynthesis protein FliR